MARLCVIFPVLNEYDNVKRVLLALPTNVDIILVDDGSTDGVGELEHSLPNVRIIERGKPMGIISAIIDGMKEALNGDEEYIVTMDGDGQHDPSYLDAMLEFTRKEGADLTIGSRYIKGGAADGFTPFRREVSRVANYFYRISFDGEIRDATSGFRVYSRRAAAYLVRNPPSRGYVGQVEIVNELHRAGMKIEEFPITFRRRMLGKSKLSWADILDYFIYTLVNGNLWKYLVVGFSGITINELFLFLLAPRIWFPVADIIAIEVSITTNFMFNELWTFSGKKLDHGLRGAITRFCLHNASSMLGLSVNFIVFIGLALLGYNLLLANLVGIIAAFSIRYLISSQVIWVDRHR
ncbi:MAG: glycosyltransferase [Conexivisphaerales archaeon]